MKQQDSQLIQHINSYKETLSVWIATEQQIQVSNDVVIPIVKAYQKETGNVVLSHNGLILEALKWGLSELNKSVKGKAKLKDGANY